MTLVGYFNATRELAGMARYMADDVAEPGQAAAQGLRLSPRDWARRSACSTSAS